MVLKTNKSKYVFIITIFIIAMVLSLLSLGIGSVHISYSNLLKVFFYNTNSLEKNIILNIRMPRIFLGFFVGSSLSLAGVLMQGIFRNHLVEPFTLGISGGASLGVAFAISMRLPAILGYTAYPVSAFTGGTAVIVLIWAIGYKHKNLSLSKILLTGVMLSFIASSVMILVFSLVNSQKLHSIIFWTMGSLEQPETKLIILSGFVSMVSFLVSVFFINPLNALAFGEDEATQLGINVNSIRLYILLLSSVLTAITVSVAGIIGFVGLVIPHIMRFVLGEDHKFLIISSWISGGIFLVSCDIIARTIALPIILPTGVITGIVGGIFFITMLNSTKDYYD